jgi:hypothetical protein
MNANLSVEDRVKTFKEQFPQYCPPQAHNGRLYTTWVIGALYKKGNDYYGSFPHSLEKRIMALFPDARQICHLFSGTLQAKPPQILTYDIKPEMHPSICDDVMNILDHKTELANVDLFIADPPYEHSDFEKYGIKPFDKPECIRRIGYVAKAGAHLVWLDTRIPIYNKKVWALLGYIGVVVSTNTRMRCLTLLERTSVQVPVGRVEKSKEDRTKIGENFEITRFV